MNSERQNRGAIFVNIERQNRGAIFVNIERQNGEGRSISVNRERPKRGAISVNKERQNGGEDLCELYCEAAPPCPRIRPPYTFCQPLLFFFLSSHSVTRVSSRGREEEKPRVRGNRGMGE